MRGEEVPSGLDMTMAHPELFGLRTKQLPATASGGVYSQTLTFEYEFDKEGYISRILGGVS